MPGAPFINRKVMAFSRLEAERGVAEVTPTSDDSRIVLRDIKPDMNLDKIEQLVSAGRYAELAALIGVARCGFKATHDIQLGLAAGPSGVLPMDKYLRSMGQKPAATTGVQAYTPNHDQDVAQTQTIWVVYVNPDEDQDEIVIGIRGAKGGGNLKFAIGKPLTYEIEMEGVLFFAGPWPGTFPAYAHSPAALRAPVLLAGTLSFNGNSRSVSEGTLALGHTLTPVEDAGPDEGLAYVHIADRKPTLQMKVRADLHGGNEEFLQSLLEPDNCPTLLLETQVVATELSSTPYTARLALEMPKLNVRKIGNDDIGGDLAWSVDAVPIETTGGDEFTLREEYEADD